MKIAVLNFSGNVGKTTISNCLLMPRLSKPVYIPVETINKNDDDSEGFKGKQFRELYEVLNMVDNAVVDIGSSNVESLMQVMRQIKGSHDTFDVFIIPVTPINKQQRDTISTIEELASIGISPEKIKLVFNFVEPGDDVSKIFSGIYQYHENKKRFTFSNDAVIHNNEIFQLLRESGIKSSIVELSNDKTDYRDKIKSTDDKNEKLRYSRMISLVGLAEGIIDELDSVYAVLFPNTKKEKLKQAA